MTILASFILSLHYIIPLAFCNVNLDQEHLSMYPYCGKLFGYEWHDASSRVVNSRESEIQYPWVVLMTRSYKGMSYVGNKPYRRIKERSMEAACSGTVIADK